jgi:hypothetical protein
MVMFPTQGARSLTKSLDSTYLIVNKIFDPNTPCQTHTHGINNQHTKMILICLLLINSRTFLLEINPIAMVRKLVSCTTLDESRTKKRLIMELVKLEIKQMTRGYV